MPDSPQNGHHDAPPLHPLLRPALGERAGRGLNALETDAPDQEIETAPLPEPEAPLAPASFLDADADENGDDFSVLAHENGGGAPPEPPLNGGFGSNGFGGNADTPNDQELGLIEHLSELRVRILWCFVAVGVGMVLTWNRCLQISEWFAQPIKDALKGKGTLISTSPTGFFTIYLQISLISALILTMPFILFQVWRFTEPALTKNERKYGLVLVPFSSTLFFLGAGMGYLMTPMFFKFFLLFQPPTGVLANWDYFESVTLMGKTLLVFGIAFQVPVLTIFLNKTGIVSRNLLIQYWRHAIVVIFTLIAFVVPTWDPLTMTACALPPCLLYLLSIWLVKWL